MLRSSPWTLVVANGIAAFSLWQEISKAENGWPRVCSALSLQCGNTSQNPIKMSLTTASFIFSVDTGYHFLQRARDSCCILMKMKSCAGSSWPWFWGCPAPLQPSHILGLWEQPSDPCVAPFLFPVSAFFSCLHYSLPSYDFAPSSQGNSLHHIVLSPYQYTLLSFYSPFL